MRISQLFLTGLFVVAAPAFADDRVDHFKGEPSKTLDQALANLAAYNEKLSAVIGNETLTPQQMHEVHVLTYTLENAVARIDDELEEIAENLEAVHKASEHADPATVKARGKLYLEASGKLVQ